MIFCFKVPSWNHLTQAQFMSDLELSQIVFFWGRERGTKKRARARSLRAPQRRTKTTNGF